MKYSVYGKLFLGLLVAQLATSTLFAHGYPVANTLSVNAQRTGQSPFVGPWSSKRTETWPSISPYGIDTSPAIAQDRTLYFGTRIGVEAFDRHGNVKWIYTAAGEVQSTPSIGPSHTIYAGGSDGVLHAINADGADLWTFATKDAIVSSPAITTDGMIYVTSTDGSLYKVTDRGDLEFHLKLQGPILNSPAIGADGTVYIGNQNKLYAIAPSGELLDSREVTGKQITAAPCIASDGSLFIVSSDANRAYLDVFSPSSGEIRWTATLPRIPQGAGVALSPDESLIYVPTEKNLTAISTDNGRILWTQSGKNKKVNPPLVDIDGNVYWANANRVRSFTRQGTLRWTYSPGSEQLGPPALDPVGTLFFGGTTKAGEGSLHAIKVEFQWPTSDERIDAAHGYRIDLNKELHDSMQGIPIVENWSEHNLSRVEPSIFSGYNWDWVEYHRRWGRTNDYRVPLGNEQVEWIMSYNPSFTSYNVTTDNKEHHDHFDVYFRTMNPHTQLGSYIASTTCVDNPTAQDNLLKAGNVYPQSAMNCCEFLENPNPYCHDVTAPFSNEIDGRWYLDFTDSLKIDGAVQHLERILDEQHFGTSVFLDNGRNIQAYWQDAALCQQKYQNCINACAGEPTCLDECESNTSSEPECYDRNLDKEWQWQPHPTTYPDYGMWTNDLYDYYNKLIAMLDKKGLKGILNLPGTLAKWGNYIENEPRTELEEILGTHGLAFEMSWHVNDRHSPKYAQQEIDVLRQLLAQGKLVNRYGPQPKQMWMAAMATCVREPGQSLFVMRLPSQAPANWVHFPKSFGAPTGPLSPVRTNCTDCLNQRGGFPGDWFVERSFENGNITVAHLNFDIETYKDEGTTLDPAMDIINQTIDLEGLLNENHGIDYTEFEPPEFGTWSSGEYTAEFAPIAADFKAKHGEHISFGSSNSVSHRMEEFYTIGKNCNGDYCKDMIAVSVIINHKIHKNTEE